MNGVVTQCGMAAQINQAGGEVNLVTNGDFSTGDLTGWIDVQSHWSVVGGRAFHDTSSVFNLLLTAGIPAVGQSCRLRFTIDEELGDGVRCQFRDASFGLINGPLYGAGQDNSAATTGTYDTTVVVPAGAVYLGFARDRSGSSSRFYVDNVIVNNV